MVSVRADSVSKELYRKKDEMETFPDIEMIVFLYQNTES